MSGGTFDYIQYRFTEIYERIQSVIDNNEENEYYNFSAPTIAEFRKAVDILKRAQVYAQRIDWLLSGDNSEETFHERLVEDLKKI